MKLRSLIALLAFVGSSFAHAESIKPYIGFWLLTRMVGSSAVSMSPRHAKALVGETIKLAAGSARFPGAACSTRATATVTLAIVDDVLKDDQLSRADINLPADQLTRRAPYIQFDCISALVTTRGHLVVLAFNGYVYEATRSETHRNARS